MDTEPLDARTFALLVVAMLDAQQHYFTTRSLSALADAKAQEQNVRAQAQLILQGYGQEQLPLDEVLQDATPLCRRTHRWQP